MSETKAGWAAPRIVAWAMLILGAGQTALGASGFGIFPITWHGYDLTAAINTALTFASMFTHSVPLGSLHLPPWFGPLAAFAATAGTWGLPEPAAGVVSLLAVFLATVSKSVSNATAGDAPATAWTPR